jgi:hypothetical protein
LYSFVCPSTACCFRTPPVGWSNRANRWTAVSRSSALARAVFPSRAVGQRAAAASDPRAAVTQAVRAASNAAMSRPRNRYAPLIGGRRKNQRRWRNRAGWTRTHKAMASKDVAPYRMDGGAGRGQEGGVPEPTALRVPRIGDLGEVSK